MRKIFFFFVVIFWVMSAKSQDIVGTWNGTLSVQGYDLRLVFNITQDGETYKATMDSPDQGAKDIAVNSVTFENNELKMSIDVAKADYVGKLNGNTLTGTFTQMGYAIPLELTRAAETSGGTNGFIRGRLFDSQTKEPLLFSNVVLIQDADSSFITGVTTDDNGRFSLEKLKDGKYRLKISNMGYHTYISPAVELRKGENRQDLGSFYINPSTTQLTEVEIVATRPVLEQQAGKLVFNVSESSTSVGDNALETLKKFPGVMVDQDDNISLNGKSGVLVMVDDRPTRLSGTQLANLLKSLPSSQVDKIEAIDNPSAKYDAEGVSGILNIKTKRTRMMGYSGSVFAGTRYNEQFEKSAGFDLNFRSHKITTYGSFNIFENSSKSGNIGELNQLSGEQWRINERDGENRLSEQGGRYLYGKAGIDYYMNSRNILSLSYQYNDGKGGPNTGEMRTRRYLPGADTAYSSFTQTYNSDYNFGNHNVSMNYQHILDSAKKRQFFIDASWIKNYQGGGGENEMIYYLGDITGTSPYKEGYYLDNPLAADIFSIKGDLEFPLDSANKTTLEAGVKYSYAKNDNEQTQETDGVFDERFSDHYIYAENIAAFYGMVNHTFSPKLSLQAGLRGEYTLFEGENKTMRNGTHRNDYFSLFPTLNLNSQISQKSGLNFSYRYRLTRPNYRDLNPIVTRNDAFNYTMGNTDLNPEYSHALSLRYSYNHVPIVTLNYEHSDGMVNRIATMRGDTSYTQPQNIGKSDRIGLGLMMQKNFFSKWQMMVYFDASYFWSEYTYNGKREEANNYRGSAYMSNDITLSPTMSLEVTGWCVLPSKSLFTENGSIYALNAGIRKSFFKKALTVTLSVNDIFNTGNTYSIDAKYPTGESSYQEYYWQSRSISLRLSYRFGKGNVRMRQLKNAAEEESGRSGGGQQGQGGGMGR